MIYFFASQMQKHVSKPAEDVQRSNPPNVQIHRLDALLAKVGMHASYSPLVARFETIPVEIPETPGSSRPKAPRHTVHDTVLLMKFGSKRAREEWIATREWQEFMEKTEKEAVFRRIPHVRCARSMKGLMDPIDVLTA